MKLRLYVVCVGIALLFGCSKDGEGESDGVVRSGSAAPSIQITAPVNGNTVYQRKVPITGTVTGLQPNRDVRLYVTTNKEYLQGNASIRSDTTWEYDSVILGAIHDSGFSATVTARADSAGGETVSDSIRLTRKTIRPGTPVSLKILAPKNEQIWTRRIPVRGTSTGMEPGTFVEIVVVTNRKYSQGETEIEFDGQWRMLDVPIGDVESRNLNAKIYAQARTPSGIVKSNVVEVYRSGEWIEEGEKYSWGPAKASFAAFGLRFSFNRRDGWETGITTAVWPGVSLTKTLERNRRLIVYIPGRPPKTFWYRKDQDWKFQTPPKSITIYHTARDDIEIYLPADTDP